MTDERKPTTGQEILDELEARDWADEFPDDDEEAEPPEPESAEAAVHWAERFWRRSS